MTAEDKQALEVLDEIRDWVNRTAARNPAGFNLAEAAAAEIARNPKWMQTYRRFRDNPRLMQAYYKHIRLSRNMPGTLH